MTTQGTLPGAVVVGGGIAGLVSAWELARAGVRPLLVEARGYLGGLIARGTVEQTAGAAHDLKRLADGLGALVGRFKV